MEQVYRVFPGELRAQLERLPPKTWAELEEIRLRTGQPVRLWGRNRVESLAGELTRTELEQVIRLASRCSIHAVLPQLRQGFLTLPGGHRLGICGRAVLREGEIHAIEPVSSLNLRLARQMRGVAEPLMERLCPKGEFRSTLILAPPGAGKTTLLRDVIRCLSDGVGCVPHRVSLADERGEVAAMQGDGPQLYVGENTDVMEGCPKAQGLMLLLRGMNPQVLCADEITAREDIEAMSMAAGCGVELLCTAHGASRDDLERRGLYRALTEQGVFRRLLTIRVERGERRYQVEEMA
ncbi:MAG: stage III sporulation protein AB [Clostridium sp.]|nr:stage III sporulation protein AB [Clostridium sp.]